MDGGWRRGEGIGKMRWGGGIGKRLLPFPCNLQQGAYTASICIHALTVFICFCFDQCPDSWFSVPYHARCSYWYKNGCLFPDMMTVFMSVDPCRKANGCLQVSKVDTFSVSKYCTELGVGLIGWVAQFWGSWLSWGEVTPLVRKTFLPGTITMMIMRNNNHDDKHPKMIWLSTPIR